MRGRTTIWITHRLSTVEKADHSIVLKEGAIIEQGTHSQLIQASGYYRQVLELQRMATTEALGELVDVTPRFLPGGV